MKWQSTAALPLDQRKLSTDLVIRDLLLGGLLSPKRDGVADELTVLLHQVLQSALLNIFQLILLQKAT
jgi:hypothetical protein